MIRRSRSIFAGDIKAMGWPVLAYFVRPLLLYVRFARPQSHVTPFTEPEIVA